VVSLYKRGDKDKTQNYKGIALLCTAYKIYAEVVKNRLEKKVEEKGVIPKNQTSLGKADQ